MAILVNDDQVGRIVQQVQQKAGTVATSGDTPLLAAPGAGKRIVVVAFTVQNESDQATVVLLKAGASTQRRVLCHNQGDGYGREFHPAHLWRLPENTALTLNLSGANVHNYTVDYFVEGAA